MNNNDDDFEPIANWIFLVCCAIILAAVYVGVYMMYRHHV